MTVPAFVSEQAVRDYIKLNATATSNYTSDTIGSNIRQASWMIERLTRRIYRDEPSLTLLFNTENRPRLHIPGLRTASAVTLSSAPLVANSSYWLIPDTDQSGVYTGIQFRPFGQNDRSDGPWYLSYPDWFDRNLDSPRWGGSIGRGGTLPNDLSITGAWGYIDANLPEPVRSAAKVLAAWYTIRPDALLSGVKQTESGIFDLSALPLEVQMFVDHWSENAYAVGV